MGHPGPGPMGHHPVHHPMSHAGAMSHHSAGAIGHHAMGHHPAQAAQAALPSNPYGFPSQGMPSHGAAPPRSNALVFVLIVVLIAAIAVLAYLVMTKQ